MILVNQFEDIHISFASVLKRDDSVQKVRSPTLRGVMKVAPHAIAVTEITFRAPCTVNALGSKLIR